VVRSGAAEAAEAADTSRGARELRLPFGPIEADTPQFIMKQLVLLRVRVVFDERRHVKYRGRRHEGIGWLVSFCRPRGIHGLHSASSQLHRAALAIV
jgi:hypothetical protein